MSNLGKAIYMACFALLFVVAATTAIYLYGTLNTYLDSSTALTTIADRAEGISVTQAAEREITRSEIYITLYNMEQMHINKLIVDMKSEGEFEVTSGDNLSDTSGRDYDLVYYLNLKPNYRYTYKYDPSNACVTYTQK